MLECLGNVNEASTTAQSPYDARQLLEIKRHVLLRLAGKVWRLRNTFASPAPY